MKQTFGEALGAIASVVLVLAVLSHSAMSEESEKWITTARVWMARYHTSRCLSWKGTTSTLRQATGAIRHYGANIYLVFDGRKVIDRDVWLPTSRSLEVDFKN